MVELKDVSVTYSSGVDALHNVNLKINDGDFAFVVGASGAGKSTMIKLILKEINPTSGSIYVNGYNLNKLRRRRIPALRRTIGFVFQDFRLIPSMTVYENVAFVLRVIDAPTKYIRKRVPYVIGLVGLQDKTNAYPDELSGGEKQRIAIARALATNPKVLLCDEATSALDPNTTHAILQLIQKINREMGITVVIITHQMSVVEDVCSHVAILDNGTVVEQGSVRDIFSNPHSDAAKRLVFPAGTPERELLPGRKMVRVAFNGTQTTDKPLVASLAIECGALVSIVAADTRVVNGQTLGSMLLALPEDEHAEAALEYIKNYPGITYEEVNN